MKKELSFILAMAFLIVGVSIGAGILGLPLELGLSGFWPSLLALFLVWSTMFSSGAVFLYKLINSKYEVQDFAMLYQMELGTWAKYLNTIFYFLTFYCLIIAYISGISSILVTIFPELHAIPHVARYVNIIFILLVVPVVMYGMNFMRRINSVLIILIFILFISLLLIISSDFNASYLTYHNWKKVVFEMPILVTAFGYHIILPIIYRHSKKNNISRKGLFAILIFGTSIVLILNLVWIMVVLGALPLHSIAYAYQKGYPVTIPLVKLTNSHKIVSVALGFSLLTITAACIGVGAGLMNYIKDFTGYYLKKRNKLTDAAFTFILPVVIVMTYPHMFIKMLGVVGGLGVIACFGVLPALLALKSNNPFYIRVLGLFIFIFSLLIVAIEVFNLV